MAQNEQEDNIHQAFIMRANRWNLHAIPCERGNMRRQWTSESAVNTDSGRNMGSEQSYITVQEKGVHNSTTMDSRARFRRTLSMQSIGMWHWKLPKSHTIRHPRKFQPAALLAAPARDTKSTMQSCGKQGMKMQARGNGGGPTITRCQLEGSVLAAFFAGVQFRNGAITEPRAGKKPT